jgi:hypothetical protein
MLNITSIQASSAQAPQLLSLSTRLTVGSAVGFTEGLFAAIMLAVPQNHWVYIISALLSLLSWLAFWRFRDTKVGADIGDIWFYEFVFRCMILLFANAITIDVVWFWYTFTALSVLKIIRVYLWASTATQQVGWIRFGPMTWFYGKNYAASNPPTVAPPRGRLLAEMVVALLIASAVSAGIKFLEDGERVAVMWIVPFAFEFLFGPLQLRNLKIFNNLLFASTQRETEQAAKIAELEQKLTALQNAQSDPDGVNTELNAYYYGIHPEQRPHFLGVGNKMRQLYPVEPK